MARGTDASSHLVAPGYGVAVLFIVLPIVDTLSQMWPFPPGNPSWLYGMVGLGANYLISFVFGMGLAVLIAGLAGHRRTLRALAVLSGVVTILLLISVAGFALD